MLNSSQLSGLDFLLFGSILASSVFLGFFLGRKEYSTEDFFRGGRSLPAWAVCLSFVATEISALTIIGVPATSFRENWEYAQFFIGSFAARIAIAYLFIPAFYQYNCTSIYEFLFHRFGKETQVAGSILFFITRLLASGVRLMAACLAVSVMLNWPLFPTIVAFTIISTLYITYGGIKAVVWTNVVQALTFIAAGIASIFFILSRIDGGLSAVWAIAEPAGRLNFWRLGPDPLKESLLGFVRQTLADPNIFWIAILNGFLGSMAAYGTDQELMQRMLTIETRRKSQQTMIWTTLGSLLVLLIYLSIGSLLFVFFQQNPGLPLPEQIDKIFPYFADRVMPSGLRGLVLAAIVMASIDSPLNSLSSSFVTDIYRVRLAPAKSEQHYLWVSRLAVVGFGLLLAVIAYFFSHFNQILWLAFKISGVTYGSLLGAFLLGLLTRRRCDFSLAAGMVASSLCAFILLLLAEKQILPLGWSWLLVIGTIVTYAWGWWQSEEAR